MWRILVRAGLVLLGVSTILFFAALYLIADCSRACIARGERVPIFGFIGLGAALLTFGLAWSAGARPAAARALLAGGGVTLAGALWAAAEGARGGLPWIAVGAGVAALAAGAALARAQRPST